MFGIIVKRFVITWQQLNVFKNALLDAFHRLTQFFFSTHTKFRINVLHNTHATIRRFIIKHAAIHNCLRICNVERQRQQVAVDLGDFRESKYARGVWNLYPSGCIVNPPRVTRNPRWRDYKVAPVTVAAF